MLRSLGQNPTEKELDELIDSVDEGDKDGQIQLREFLKLYTQSLDTKASGAAGKEDVNNVFYAMGVRRPPHQQRAPASRKRMRRPIKPQQSSPSAHARTRAT